MNRSIQRVLCAALAFLLCISGASAQVSTPSSVCRDAGLIFAFFNGVQTTKAQAEVAKQEFKHLHGDQSASGDRISYEVMYNYSNGFEDFVETFEQRLLEQEGLLEGRFELFFEALKGDGPWWSRIIDSVASAAGILKGFVDWYEAAAVRSLTALLGNPPTSVNYAEHRSRIQNWVIEGKKILIVAHSQGNLFANAAYNFALSQTTADSVKLVHIAPASPALNGRHTLADLDLVINGLRAIGSVASITDFIPGYLLRPAGVNGQKDALGHGLLEIYINQGLVVSSRVKSHIEAAKAALVAPPVQATSGFFTATLTWDGSGDVDLHAYEPDGSHVYYAEMTGNSGYLDVDNVVANGPEHYYASCDAATLQPGTYQVKLANYNAADGRTATVQIASWNDGVLGTKSVTLGEATGDIPAHPLFNVVVTKNAQTGKFSVAIGQ